MKNDYRLLPCSRCGQEEPHFRHWTCGEYTLCLGCSQAGRRLVCPVCVPGVTLLEQGRYRVTVERLEDGHLYNWNLHVVPDKKAWRLQGETLRPGEDRFGHRIVKIEVISEPDG